MILPRLLKHNWAILLLSFCFGHFSQSQVHTFRHFNHRDGLPIVSLNAIEETRSGLILLGTDGSGIVQFDGTEFKELNPGNGAEYNYHVTSIARRKGQIYFSSLYKGFYQIDRKRNNQIIPLKEQLTSEALKLFALDSNLLGVTRTHVYLEKDGVWNSIFRFPNNHERNEFIHSIEVPDGILLFMSSGNYFFSFRSKNISSLSGHLNFHSTQAAYLKFGYYADGKLELFSRDLSYAVHFDLDKKGKPSTPKTEEHAPLTNSIAISCTFNKVRNRFVVLTNNGDIYEKGSAGFVAIARNALSPIDAAHTILADRNGDYWISSYTRGLYKVSIEPFTKLQFHSGYLSSTILFSYVTAKGTLLFSNADRETYLGSLDKLHSLKLKNIRLTAQCNYKGTDYFGSSDGLLSFDEASQQFITHPISTQLTGVINSLACIEDTLFIGVANDGLYKLNMKDGRINKTTGTKKSIPKYYYTFQLSLTDHSLLCGTNDGVFRYNFHTQKLSQIEESKTLGSFSGLSAKDKFGTIWFTLDNGLFGILANGEYVKLEAPKLFNSFLFYTLNTDQYGHLILGTNKGLNFIEVDEKGRAQETQFYTGTTGFDGYETHMRSQFQNKDFILLGTIEGLYMVFPSVLESLKNPSLPNISRLTSYTMNSSNSKGFKLSVNQSKLPVVYYSFRLIGAGTAEWSPWDETREIMFNDLPGGNYTLEVRASYNKDTSSPVASRSFVIDQPFYTSGWFIGLFIALLVIFNLFLLNRMKSFEGMNIFGSQDVYLIQKLTPTLLLVGFIGNTAAHMLAPNFDIQMIDHFQFSVIVGIPLFLVYLTSIFVKRWGDYRKLSTLLIIGYSIIAFSNYYTVVRTQLHPYFIIGLILILSMFPFVFNKFRSSVIFGAAVILLSAVATFIISNSPFDKYLFLIVMTLGACVSVFISFLRFDSISKLSFISGVINNGNVPALAYDKQGKIIYVSENIGEFFPSTSDELLGLQVETLKAFIPKDQLVQNEDLKTHFKDGQKVQLPMFKTDEIVTWIEWSCTLFSDDVMVLFGQDITDKLELQNTYELLVQNAEDLIYQVDVQGKFIFVNDRFHDRMGYDKDELIGTDSLELIPEEYHEQVFNYYSEQFKERKNITYHEFPIKKKNGDIIWIGQYVTTLYAHGSTRIINAFLALARDITEKRTHLQIIESQSGDITSSINYAKRIQDNLLPSTIKFENSFNESMIFYRPKDIVSGDFYWLERLSNYTVFVLADCTGHGVPGSFMSLLGINLLNSIVKEDYNLDPGKILDQIDAKLRETLPRKHNNIAVNDGMEMTLCIFDHKTDRLTFACAGSRFLIYDKSSFNLYKGDNKHIGDDSPENFTGYVSHTTNFGENQTIYMFTDGFQDQFGGRRNKKYSFKRMLELFEANIRLDLNDQYEMVKQEFEQWQDDVAQTDDVTVIAIRGLKK